MVEFSCIEICAAEVGGLVHAASCHDSDQFIEKLIAHSVYKVQTVCQISRCFILELVAQLRHDFLQCLQIVHFGRGVSSEDAERGEALIYFFSDCDVGEEHKFFNEIISFHHLVHFHVGGTVGLFFEGNLDLR